MCVEKECGANKNGVCGSVPSASLGQDIREVWNTSKFMKAAGQRGQHDEQWYHLTPLHQGFVWLVLKSSLWRFCFEFIDIFLTGSKGGILYSEHEAVVIVLGFSSICFMQSWALAKSSK